MIGGQGRKGNAAGQGRRAAPALQFKNNLHVTSDAPAAQLAQLCSVLLISILIVSSMIGTFIHINCKS